MELLTKIRKKIVSAMADYEMVEKDDKVLVAVSGGKDSTILFILMEEIRKLAPFPFVLEGVLIDQNQPGFNALEFQKWIEKFGLKLNVIFKNTYDIIIDKVENGKTYCSLCSRLRRGILYDFASSNGYNKIALGHHMNDINETVLMNMFFAGELSSMPPKLISDDKRNTIIRPMAYVDESDLIEAKKELNIPTIPCNLCGSQKTRRVDMKNLLTKLNVSYPGLSNRLLASQKNIKPSQLADKNLWKFS